MFKHNADAIMNTTITLVGITRSKAEIIAKVLHLLGVHMNPTTINKENEKWYPIGSWEERILSEITHKDENLIEKYKNFYAIRNDTIVWGYKSHRIIFNECFKTKEFLKLNPAQNQILIKVERNINDCIQEYSKLIGKPAFQGLFHTQKQKMDELYENWQDDKLTIYIEEFIQTPEKSCKKLKEFLGLFDHQDYFPHAVNTVEKAKSMFNV